MCGNDYYFVYLESVFLRLCVWNDNMVAAVMMTMQKIWVAEYNSQDGNGKFSFIWVWHRKHNTDEALHESLGHSLHQNQFEVREVRTFEWN